MDNVPCVQIAESVKEVPIERGASFFGDEESKCTHLTASEAYFSLY